MIIATTEEIPGHRVVETEGVAYETAVVVEQERGARRIEEAGTLKRLLAHEGLVEGGSFSRTGLEDARVCGSGYPTCWGVYEVGNLTRR